MTQEQPKYELKKAVKERTALMIGIAGETGTGKTVSAIRLGIGMCKVLGGRVAVIDTNGRRALNYAEIYDFDHLDMAAPFGPLNFMSAIELAVHGGAKVVVIDSMSDEHSGDGGVMDQIEKFLDEKAADDWGKREKLNMVAHARIKPQRKKLNNYLVQLGRKGVVMILCYRAHDKVKPIAGQGIKRVGFEPETTSTLRFEMTQAFLLMPGAKGKPTVKPETFEEIIWSKTPMQFEGWMTGLQLDESLGMKLAQWAAGSKVASPASPSVGGEGGAVVTEVATAPPKQSSPVGTEAHPPAGSVGSATTSSGQAPHDNAVIDNLPTTPKPGAWQIQFFGKLAPLKKANEAEYYRILGSHGYEHANGVPSRAKALEIYEEMKGAIQ